MRKITDQGLVAVALIAGAVTLITTGHADWLFVLIVAAFFLL